MCLIEFKRAQETRVSRRQKPYSVYCKRELRIGPEGEEATLQKLRAWLLAAPSFKSGAEHRQHHPNDIADKAPAVKGSSQGKKQSSSSSSSSSSSDSSSSSSSSRNSSPQKKKKLEATGGQKRLPALEVHISAARRGQALFKQYVFCCS